MTHRPVHRRLLLTLGAAAFLGACSASPPARPRAATASPSGIPGDSHPQPSGATGTPTPGTAPSPWRPPAVPKATPDGCLRIPGIVQRPGGPQHYLPCNGTDIALTIDDGPDPTWTPQVLALLARYQITATFCMIGRHAAAHPDLVTAVAGAGHHVANHTLTHPLHLPRLSPTQIATEVSRATDILTRAAGRRPTMFRAPGGNWSPTVLAACAAAGMRPLDWSVDPRDWSMPGVPHIASVILTHTHPGAIILDHDGGGNRQQTLDALSIALPRLLDAGYRFTQP